MTPKERAHLRGLANGIDTVLQIGKDGIGETLIHQADITLEARELIKGRVLEGCMDYTPRTAAEALAEATGSEVVQVIGSKFVLYRKKSPDAAKKTTKPRRRKNARAMGKHGKPERKASPSDRPGPRKASAPERAGQRKPFTPDHAAPRKPSAPKVTGPRKGGFKSGPARAGRRDTPHRGGKPSYGTGKPSYGGKNRK